ncbi:MAG: NAD(P)/FAD-dependent oxidoreductase [Xenococcaceae cyanobacterium]
MNATQQLVYDVVIMGAGFAGNCQARHLLLNVPGIKVAIVDPRSPERSTRDLKVGESTVEISAMFLYKELGLYEYLIENHAPKYGLNFHWPKDASMTETTNDYFHIWTNRNPPLASFQINRAKFEQDVLKMNLDMGGTFYNGRVVDIDLTPKDELKTVKVKLDGEHVELRAKHVVDAAGRKFLIGKKTDNLIFDPEKLYGLNTGSAWLRVKDVNRDLFHTGYDPLNGGASHYYGTNHWFGHGHWLWMIPIETNSRELSIGIVHHHNVIEAKEISTKEKFLEFLKANHTVLYKMIASGEIVDFNYLPRLVHGSKTMLSEDNWYVIGDAANMYDPFYSPGMVLTAVNIEGVTEVVRAKLAGEPDAQKKQEYYNQFNIEYARAYNQVYQAHDKHLGDASIMSWRIYMENMFWFGILIPMYVGKWHLDFEFISQFLKISQWLFFGRNALFPDFYEQFTQLVEQGKNIGMMDYVRADQLFWGYVPTKHFDHFMENTKFEPRRCNVYAGMKATFFFAAFVYAKLRLKGFGLLGLLAPRRLARVVQLLAWSAYVAVGEQIYLFKTRKQPDSTVIEQTNREFNQTYRYKPELQPWGKSVSA